MDCKNALQESNGDMNAAVDYLRKKGAKIAELRAGRDANEGVIVIKMSEDKRQAIMLQLGCETDFVSRNETFNNFANALANLAYEQKAKDLDALLEMSLNGVKVSEKIQENIAAIGENISIQNYIYCQAEGLQSYNHDGRIGVIVMLNKENTVATHEITLDVCMQIAAMKPVAVDESDIDQQTKDRELAIGREKAIADGKPEAMIEKIAEGALNKFYKENTLLKQEFFKNNKESVGQAITKVDKDLKVLSFKKFELGVK
jgi:elongation factor Ts